jgi:hypothetical protein
VVARHGEDGDLRTIDELRVRPPLVDVPVVGQVSLGHDGLGAPPPGVSERGRGASDGVGDVGLGPLHDRLAVAEGRGAEVQVADGGDPGEDRAHGSGERADHQPLGPSQR